MGCHEKLTWLARTCLEIGNKSDLLLVLMKKDVTEASPMKAVLEELDNLEKVFRETLEKYAARLEAEIATVREKVVLEQEKKKVPNTRLHELRDMLTLLHQAQAKVDKGRRKDLKKIDGIIGDLAMLSEKW
jgi:hypothetical protein